MTQVDTLPVSVAIEQAVSAIIEQYRSVPAIATERALAMLALWAADAIAAGRLTPKAADATFVRLYVELDNPPAGPELSDDVDQLMIEALALDDWALSSRPMSTSCAVWRSGF